MASTSKSPASRAKRKSRTLAFPVEFRLRIVKLYLEEGYKYGLAVTVCHYPTGASKWNPIEHRLFSEISKNWAGEPLVSIQTALNFIRTTETSTGLHVSAMLNRKHYQCKEKIPKEEAVKMIVQRNSTFPDLNYRLLPPK